MLIPILSTLAILAFLYLILLLIVSPTDRTHPDVHLLKGAYIAHRGLHDNQHGIPENSLVSFEKAMEKGFPIEIDIHLTKDGHVVVFHDATLTRMCGKDDRIKELTLEEIKAYHLLDTGEKIPTLEETLEKVAGRVFLLIEFKMENGNTKELCRAANQILSGYDGKYFIQSFYPQVLSWYRKNNRKVCRGLLAASFHGESLPRRMSGAMLFNFLARPDFISYKHQDGANPIRRFAVWLGAVSVGWTFRCQEELKEGKKHFESFIFEKFLPEKE